MNPQAKENTKIDLMSGSIGKLIANSTRGPEFNPQQWYKKARHSGAQLLTLVQAAREQDDPWGLQASLA